MRDAVTFVGSERVIFLYAVALALLFLGVLPYFSRASFRNAFAAFKVFGSFFCSCSLGSLIPLDFFGGGSIDPKVLQRFEVKCLFWSCELLKIAGEFLSKLFTAKFSLEFVGLFPLVSDPPPPQKQSKKKSQKKSRPKFTPNIIGIPLQLPIFAPKNFHVDFLHTGTELSEFFSLSPSSGEGAQRAPFGLLFMCQSELTELFAELTEFAAEPSEFSFRNSTLEAVFRPLPNYNQKEKSAQRGSFWDGYPADIQGSFARISRPKTSVRALKTLEKQAFGRGYP